MSIAAYAQHSEPLDWCGCGGHVRPHLLQACGWWGLRGGRGHVRSRACSGPKLGSAVSFGHILCVACYLLIEGGTLGAGVWP